MEGVGCDTDIIMVRKKENPSTGIKLIIRKEHA